MPLVAATWAVHRGFVAMGHGGDRGARAAVELVAQVAAGGAAYVATAFVVMRSMAMELVGLARNLLERGERHE